MNKKFNMMSELIKTIEKGIATGLYEMILHNDGRLEIKELQSNNHETVCVLTPINNL